jgi:predicted MPP superfamily phosphohydrolase
MNISLSHQPKLSRRDFLRAATNLSGAFAFAGLTSSFDALRLEPEWVDVVDVELTLPHLAASFAGFRIVQISDIHFGGWMNRERLAHVIDMVKDLKPDLVVMTGDHVDGDEWTAELEASMGDYVAEMSRLTAEYPVMGILGNHDYWTDAAKVREMLAQCNMIELKNDAYYFERDGERLHIAGVDDIWEGQDRLDEVLAKVPESSAAILLAHEPDYADTSAKTGRFGLQLSGHTHGGQVVVPFHGAVLKPYLGLNYPSGMYKVGDMWQYTNRGVGMVGHDIRFNCRPEITVFNLQPA